MVPSKLMPQSNSRADVTVKKILRMARNFYDQKLEHEVMYKNKRNKANPSFLVYTDFLVEKCFDKELLKLLNLQTFEEVSNKLAALIQPKRLINEIENARKDINILRQAQNADAQLC